MLEHLLIFAAWEAFVIKLIVFGAAFLIWAFNNLKKNKAQLPKDPRRRFAPPQVPPGQGDEREPAAGGGQKQQLAGEIEAFLKRANDKRRDKKPRQPAQAKKAAPKPPPAAAQPARRLVQSEADQQGFEVRSTQSVADHVQQRLDTRSFGERAAHMVDDLEKQDVQREAHRKHVFDHQLGRLADTSVAAVVPTEAAAGQAASQADSTAVALSSIASLLTNPEKLKQAIVLNEILTRPEHRW